MPHWVIIRVQSDKEYTCLAQNLAPREQSINASYIIAISLFLKFICSAPCATFVYFYYEDLTISKQTDIKQNHLWFSFLRIMHPTFPFEPF